MELKCNKKTASWNKGTLLYSFEYLYVYIVIVTNWSIDK